MRLLLDISGFWPGLASAWRGERRGVGWAIGFGLTLDAAFILSFASWSAAVPPGWGWFFAGLCWVLVLGLSVAGRRGGAAAAGDELLDAWFIQAQRHYLKGHWIEAETLVARLLSRQPNDIEARLLLASIERRTGRLAEARATLRRLRDCPGAEGWRFEIDAELRQIEEREAESRQRAA
jgi:hypothetical protein